MRATTVLWDIDGTLVSSGGVAARAFLDAVAEVTGVRPSAGRRDYGGRLDPEIAGMLLAAVGAAPQRVADVLAALERLVAGRLAAAGWRPEPGQVWIVGDTPRDLACAQAIGIRCALVATGRRALAELTGWGADIVLTALSDPRPCLTSGSSERAAGLAGAEAPAGIGTSRRGSWQVRE